MMGMIEELTEQLPGLDCGSCGAPTCRALAEDIVRGNATKNDCIYTFHEYISTLSKDISFLMSSLEQTTEDDKREESIQALKENIQKLTSEIEKVV